MQGVTEFLWFVHRTLFELMPIVVADVFIYLFLIDKQNMLNLYWIKLLQNFIEGGQNIFFKSFVITGIIILTAMFIKAVSSQIFWVQSKVKENLPQSPVYIIFKNKIDEDFEKEFGKGFRFDPSEIQNLIRYKIMEEHKEFNTYLWYISTEYYTMRNLAFVMAFTSIVITPIMCFKNEIILYEYAILLGLAIIPFILIGFLIAKKISHINAIEYKEKNGSKLKFTSLDGLVIVCSSLGIFGITYSKDADNFFLNIIN